MNIPRCVTGKECLPTTRTIWDLRFPIVFHIALGGIWHEPADVAVSLMFMQERMP